MRDTVYKVGLYLRLSKEDMMLKIESMSIETQRKKLIDFANKNSMIIGGIYADDGLSGVFFDRPEFEKMMHEVENGILNCVIVKDLSRLGRNDVETNYYYEDFFLARGIRFIAIDDEVDTIKGYQQIATFKNMYNAMYPYPPKPVLHIRQKQNTESSLVQKHLMGIRNPRRISIYSLEMKKLHL